MTIQRKTKQNGEQKMLRLKESVSCAPFRFHSLLFLCLIGLTPASALCADTHNDNKHKYSAEKQEIIRLENQAKFTEALQKAQSLLRAHHDKRHEISYLMKRLRRERQAISTIRIDLERLDSSNKMMVEYMRDRILESDGRGMRILLKNMIRNEDNPFACEAVSLLCELQNESAYIPFFINEAGKTDDPALKEALLTAISEHKAPLPLKHTLAVIKLINSPYSEGHRQHLRQMLISVTDTALEAGDLATYYKQCTQDAMIQEKEQDIVELIAFYYQNSANCNEHVFDDILGGRGRTSTLRRYVNNACTSEDKTISKWAKRVKYSLSPIDYKSLRKGLVSWWSFDHVKHNGLTGDASGKSHLAQFKHTTPTVGDGKIGQSVKFSHEQNGYFESRGTSNRVFKNIHKKSYSFVAWIHPDSLPDGKQPDPFWSIVTKEGWHQGLSLHKEGEIKCEHYFAAKKRGAAKSETTSIEPGVWTHVIGSLDHNQDTIRLFINGKLINETKMPESSSWWNRHDREPVRVGAARARHNWKCRFNGRIDEVAIYQRALTATDAAQLYTIRTAEQRAGISTANSE
jgi:hypothetical protein